MAKYLDQTGVGILWGNVKKKFLIQPSTSDITANHVAKFTTATETINGSETTIVKVVDSGYTIATSVPSGAVFTDRSVTGVSYHYTPSGDGSSAVTDAQTGNLAFGAAVVTGITKDAAGHIIGVSTKALPANPVSSNTVTTTSTLTANRVMLGNGSKTIKVSDYTIGGATLASSPSSTVLATEAAVSAAVSGLTGAMHFIGSTTTALTDGATTATLAGSSLSKTTGFVAGDVVITSDGKEFVWTGSAWELLGDEGSYALKTVSVTGTGALGGGGTLAESREITHNESALGITENTKYGPTANVTGTEGATLTVPQIEVDKYGHIVGVTNRTYTSKNTTYTVGDKALNISDGTTSKKVIGVNENSSNRTLTVSGDSYITPTVGGSDNAATLSFAHATQTAYTTKGTSTKVPTITTDAGGHVTTITETSIAFPVTSVAGKTGAVTLDGLKVGTKNGSATAVDVFTYNGNGAKTLYFSSANASTTNVKFAVSDAGVVTGTVTAVSPGNATLSVASNTGTSTQAFTANSSTASSITVSGDGTWLTGAVSGSANAPVVTVSHIGPDNTSAAAVSATQSTTQLVANSSYVVTGVTADGKGHITGITTAKLPADANSKAVYTTAASGKGSGMYCGTSNTATTTQSTGNSAAYLRLKLKNDGTLNTNGVAAASTYVEGRYYPVELDKDGYLSVVVPWENTGTTDSALSETEINTACGIS